MSYRSTKLRRLYFIRKFIASAETFSIMTSLLTCVRFQLHNAMYVSYTQLITSLFNIYLLRPFVLKPITCLSGGLCCDSLTSCWSFLAAFVLLETEPVELRLLHCGWFVPSVHLFLCNVFFYLDIVFGWTCKSSDTERQQKKNRDFTSLRFRWNVPFCLSCRRNESTIWRKRTRNWKSLSSCSTTRSKSWRSRLSHERKTSGRWNSRSARSVQHEWIASREILSHSISTW